MAEASLRGQAEIWKYMFAFADSMALKCAVELRIADIIHSCGGPVTLSQIASHIDSPSPDVSYLSRIMRLLVRKKIFAVHHELDSGETLYGLTHSSRWLLHDSELTTAPVILMETHPRLMAPWHCLNQCVKESGNAFKMVHGRELWDFASDNPEFNKIFNDGVACTSKIISKEIISAYKDGFGCIGSLVDVGGGSGDMIDEIVKSYPHIKGINFDLPHVHATTTPMSHGVSHVEGDMFQAIPKADAVFLKFILHGWNDKDCVKILRNCRKAISEKNGKVIIVDIVLRPDGNDIFDEPGLAIDLLMMAHTSGKERTEVEWKKILDDGGFPRYNIINIPALPSIIEAFPTLL